MKISTVELQPYVPHRPPMIWVDEITDVTETGGVGVTYVKEGELYLSKGAVRPSVYIELVAQTYAFIQSVRLKQSGIDKVDRRALLVAVKDFGMTKNKPITAGAELKIEVTRGREIGPVTVVQGKVTCNGETLASGELKVFVADNPPK